MRRARNPNANANAFTMLELLIVIGIIALLAGITLYAMRHITTSSKAQATKVALENLRNMLGELETQTRLSRQPSEWLWQQGGANTIVNANTPNVGEFWKSPVDSQAPTYISDLDAPGNVVEGGDDNALAFRNASRAVLNTGLAMSQLAAIPSNRKAFENIRTELLFVPEWVASNTTSLGPATDHVLKTIDDAASGDAVHYPLGSRVRHNGKNYIAVVSDATGEPMPGGLTPWKEDPSPVPMLKDGWGNPIILVPASGLRVRLLLDADSLETVKADPNYTRIVTSAGAIKVPATTSDPTTPPGAKPFFASAGPDGDFSTGDDNVYSFEN